MPCHIPPPVARARARRLRHRLRRRRPGPVAPRVIAAALHGLACVQAPGRGRRRRPDRRRLRRAPPSPGHLRRRQRRGHPVRPRRRPRRAVEAAAAAEGVDDRRLARAPDRRQRARRAWRRAPRPQILQAVFRPSGDQQPDERAASGCAAHRRARRAAPTSCRARSAPSSTRAWLAPTALPTSTSTSPTSASRPSFADLPPALLDQHPAHLGAGPAVPMLCHNGEINAIEGNENRMRARAVLGTEAAGLGPEELFRPVLDDRRLRLGQARRRRRAARPGRARHPPRRGHARARGVGERRDLDPEVRGFYRYHSALMEPWDGPAGLVFTDGVGVGAALDRNGLRPLRYAVCEDGFVVCCSEVGRGRRQRPRRGRSGAASARARCCSSIPTAGRPRRRRGEGAPGRRRALRRVGGRRVLGLGPRRRRRADADPTTSSPPGRPRLHQGGAGHGAQAHGHRRQGAHLLHGRRLARCRSWPAGPGRCTTTCKQRFAQVTNPPIDPLRERW